MNNKKPNISIINNFKWGAHSSFVKIMVIRGIGYRAFYIINDIDNEENNDIKFSRYLVIRAGHTRDLCVGLPRGIVIKISKKERKLVISGNSKSLVSKVAKSIVNYRKPSVYTGRGVRVKGKKQLRKAGKKDKQKGKAY